MGMTNDVMSTDITYVLMKIAFHLENSSAVALAC